MDSTQQKSRMVLFRDAVRRLSNSMEWQITKAFEEGGCTCHPLRKERAAALEEYIQLKSELAQKLDESDVNRRLSELNKQIAETDRREHPQLDRQAEIASPFFRVWLFESLHAGVELDLSAPEPLAKAYAAAWFDGWRPQGQVGEVSLP